MTAPTDLSYEDRTQPVPAGMVTRSTTGGPIRVVSYDFTIRITDAGREAIR